MQVNYKMTLNERKTLKALTLIFVYKRKKFLSRFIRIFKIIIFTFDFYFQLKMQESFYQNHNRMIRKTEAQEKSSTSTLIATSSLKMT